MPEQFRNTASDSKNQSSQSEHDSLEIGMGIAFSPTSYAPVVGGASVLESIGELMNETPQVILADAEGDVTQEPCVLPNMARSLEADPKCRYRLDGEIARGGMGAIIRGRDNDLGRDLAVKVLLDSHKGKPEVVQRFVEEAQIGGQLQHPGIAPVYELGQFSDQRPFFTMKLVKGKTLAALLADRANPLQDQARFLGIFEQVCQTMAYAHSRKVIHRDLKPANIMVGAFGEVQVMDWGLAKVLQTGGIADESKAAAKPDVSLIETIRSSGSQTFEGSGKAGSQTRAGSVMGTPAYMSPEQAAGHVDRLDERIDVFGLGAILCEIITGKPPYVGEDGAQVMRKAIRADLNECRQRLQNCGAAPNVIEIAKHCLEAEPNQRFRSAGVVSKQITEHLESVAKKLKEAEIRRKLTYVIAAFIVLLVAGIGTGGVWMQSQKTAAAKQVAAAEGKRVEEQKAANEQLKSTLYEAEVQLASSELELGNPTEALSLLSKHKPKPGERDNRGFEWYLLSRMCLLPEVTGTLSDAERTVRWRSPQQSSKDGERLLVIHNPPRRLDDGPASQLKVVDSSSGEAIWSRQLAHVAHQMSVARISPNGKLVAMARVDRPLRQPADQRSNTPPRVRKLDIQVWEIESDREYSMSLTLEAGRLLMPFYSVLFSPKSDQLGVVNATTGAFKHLATDMKFESRITLWNVGETEPKYSQVLNGDTLRWNFAFSPTGDKILAIGRGYTNVGKLSMLDAGTGKTIYDIPTQFSIGRSASTFSPNGKLIAAVSPLSHTESFGTSRPNLLRIWDAESGEELASSHTLSAKKETDNSIPWEERSSLVFSPDSKTLLYSRSGEIFDVRTGQKIWQLGEVSTLGLESPQPKFSMDGRQIQAMDRTGSQLTWTFPTTSPRPEVPLDSGSCFTSPDRNTFVKVRWSYKAQIVSVDVYRFDSPNPINSFVVSLPAFATVYGNFLALSHDGSLLVIGAGEVMRKPTAAKILNTTTGKEVGELWEGSGNEQVIQFFGTPKKPKMIGLIAKQDNEEQVVSHEILVWDLVSRDVQTRIELQHSNHPFILSPINSESLVVLTRSGERDARLPVPNPTPHRPVGPPNREVVLSVYSLETGVKQQSFKVETTEPWMEQSSVLSTRVESVCCFAK